MPEPSFYQNASAILNSNGDEESSSSNAIRTNGMKTQDLTTPSGSVTDTNLNNNNSQIENNISKNSNIINENNQTLSNNQNLTENNINNNIINNTDQMYDIPVGE